MCERPIMVTIFKAPVALTFKSVDFFLQFRHRPFSLRRAQLRLQKSTASFRTRSSAIAEGLRDASCQLKSCQLPRNSSETTCTTSPEQIEVIKLQRYSKAMCNKHVHSTMTRSSRFRCPVGVINKLTTFELWISPAYRRLAVAKFPPKSTM